ncbi:glycosyltransferase family 25 protein [Amniculicola lignicola CBS 123094]|uniref:Glycosyltransferase family 25 protein n=1 Tax=Amniculicola lignicola CBS 123094 TaxID=1392246 RepID=A0A6A5W9F0_9PLEO|nr:glycosyltransferase family 25 protein [Amniculicola lignicola CBS 123094]
MGMMPLLSSRLKIIGAVALLLNITIFLHYFSYDSSWSRTWLSIADYSAGNRTLGFESILVVAPNEFPVELQWRKEGLLKAASYTKLDLQIPVQPNWTDEDTGKLMAKNKELKRGYALSWLGHLNALRVAASKTSSLIVEDDVDWDVSILSQTPPIADGIRKLSGYEPVANETESQSPPYGLRWDLLWLGHCGDSIVFNPEPVSFLDPTVPPFFASWEKTLSPDPQHKRFIHWSAGPICTYAYAVTGKAAQSLIERENEHGTQPYDIWLHILCKNRSLVCITVNPELFHHHEAAGVKHTLNNGITEGENEKEFTDNIWHSARCNSASNGEELVVCMGEDPRP